MKSILDPSFKWTSSTNTDIRKTFERIRKELRKGSSAPERKGTSAPVTPLIPATKKG